MINQVLTVILASAMVLLVGCDEFTGDIYTAKYRDDMQNLVVKVANRARSLRPDFVVIQQDGLTLLTKGEEFSSGVDPDYVRILDGVGCQSLFYGFSGVNSYTAQSYHADKLRYLNLAKDNGKTILVTDYCSEIVKVQDSYNQNFQLSFISFQANNEKLNQVPPFPALPFGCNSNHTTALNAIKNYLVLLDHQMFPSKYAYLQELGNSAHDLLIIDAFFKSDSLTSSEVDQLKNKSSGGRRLVLAYLSVGEAESSRYYWQPEWSLRLPEWLRTENAGEPGRYPVEYWDPRWQTILVDSSASYINKIVKAGFDGVLIDRTERYQDF